MGWCACGQVVMSVHMFGVCVLHCVSAGIGTGSESQGQWDASKWILDWLWSISQVAHGSFSWWKTLTELEFAKGNVSTSSVVLSGHESARRLAGGSHGICLEIGLVSLFKLG